MIRLCARMVSLLVVVLMVLVVPRPSAGGPARTLEFWHIHPRGAMREVLDGAVARFERANPAIKVNVLTFGMEDFKTKLAVSISGGNPPDVFHTWGGGILADMARRGQVLDLSPALREGQWGDRFTKAILSLVSFDGKAYAAPVEQAVVVFYYNTEIFMRHGLRPPRTLSELKETCTKLRGAGIIPISLGNGPKWTGSFFYMYLVSRIGGPAVFERAATRQGGSFIDPAFVEAGKRTLELVDAGCFPEGFNGMSYDEARVLYGTGRAAMILMGSWFPGVLGTEAPATEPKTHFFLFPTVEGGKGRITDFVGGTNTAYAIAARSTAQPEAIGLLREISSDATVRDLVEVAGRLVGVKVAIEPGRMPRLSRLVLQEMNRGTHLQLYYDTYLSPTLALAHLDSLQALLAKMITPQEAARRMEEAARREAGR